MSGVANKFSDAMGGGQKKEEPSVVEKIKDMLPGAGPAAHKEEGLMDKIKNQIPGVGGEPAAHKEEGLIEKIKNQLPGSGN